MIAKHTKTIRIFMTASFLCFNACSGEEGQSVQSSHSILPGDSVIKETFSCDPAMLLDQFQPITLNAHCVEANQQQIDEVNLGNSKREQFLALCYQETNNSCWCDQLIRPNPESIDIFHCTYGNQQVHQLIHPDERTWSHAVEAVKIVNDLQKMNLKVKQIYNWWRPEPYNKNVSGAAGRHPFGTSIDVKFDSKSIKDKAYTQLCRMRKQGRIRALGYYPTTAIHLGIGDKTANTWGKACP